LGLGSGDRYEFSEIRALIPKKEDSNVYEKLTNFFKEKKSIKISNYNANLSEKYLNDNERLKKNYLTYSMPSLTDWLRIHGIKLPKLS
jgi:hypothetical protein